jgi:hypothetical protein
MALIEYLSYVPFGTVDVFEFSTSSSFSTAFLAYMIQF